MYYRNNRDIWKKLYNVENFDSYDNYYYLIIDKKQAEKNYAVYHDKLKLHIDVYSDDRLLDIYKTSDAGFQSPMKIIWGHFYNDLNDLLYHPVKKDGSLWKTIFNLTSYDSVIRINNQMCFSKKYERILDFWNFFEEHPELYLSINPNENKCNYIYFDKSIYYDDTLLLDANVEGDTVVLNNFT